MNVARRGVVRVAHEEVDVADDGRLVREVADVGGHVVRPDVGARELDGALGAIGEAFDEPLELPRP